MEILPPQGQWSPDEYLILTEHSNRLVEYTDGFLEALPMPTDKHQSVLKFLLFVSAAFCWRPGVAKVQFSRRYGSRFAPENSANLTYCSCVLAADPRAAKTAFGLQAPDLALEVVSQEKPERRDLVEK